MKKNPGRKERRWLQQKNRSKDSAKRSAMNERIQKWISKGKHGFVMRDLLLSKEERISHRGF